MPSRIRSLVVVALDVASAAAAAQNLGGVRRPSGLDIVGAIRAPARYATADSFGHGFTFCRAVYTSSGAQRELGGQGWSTDYPDADRNFSIRLGESTMARVSAQASGEPEYLVVQLTDAALMQCPYLHMEDVGTAAMTNAEVDGLRTYLLKGGFLWADDFWGSQAWANWEREIGRVLPADDYPVIDITPAHPLYRTLYDIGAVPQIPSIQFWRSSGGRTSERGSDSKEPHLRGISDDHGNLMVLMTHNTDISDAWEREGEDPRFFYRFSPAGYALGVNVVLYAMTH